MSKRKQYIPNRKYNTVVMAEKLERLQVSVLSHKHEIQAIEVSYDRHVEYLANFARHDMKNAIQSMDSVLSTVDADEITSEHIQALKTNIKLIRESIDNFSKLVPYSDGKGFSLKSFITAIELLTRIDVAQRDIKISFIGVRDPTNNIIQPFHAIVQAAHNMIINSIKAFEDIESNNKHIELLTSIDNNICTVKVRDNGVVIPKENKDKIFEYGFSTSGGTGMGLCHARFLCEKINGNIIVDVTPNEEYTKEFILSFPLTTTEKSNSE